MRKFVILSVVAAAITASFFVRMELTISGEFEVLPSHNADVRAPVEAIIVEVFVKEGDRVKAGDPVARLSDRDYRAELRKIDAQIRVKRARLNLLKAGAREEEVTLARNKVETEKTRLQHAAKRYEEAKRMLLERIAKARNSVAKGEEQLRYAERERERIAGLKNRKFIPASRYDAFEQRVVIRRIELAEAHANLKMALAEDLAEARQALAVAKKLVVQAEARLKILLAGSRAENVEAAAAEISQLEAQRNYIREQLVLVRVFSPIAGIVTTPKPQEKVGRLVEKGDLIVKVLDFRTVRVEIYVPEKEVGDVVVGQQVLLKARAYSSKSFHGMVTSIAPTAMMGKDGLRRKVIRVTSDIANPGLLLKPAMTGNGKIRCGERRVIDLITRRFVRYARVEFWSWW